MEELCKSIDTIAKDWKFWRQRSFDFTGTNVPEEKFSKEEEMKYLYNAYETAKDDKVMDTLNDLCDKATKEFEEYSNSRLYKMITSIWILTEVFGLGGLILGAIMFFNKVDILIFVSLPMILVGSVLSWIYSKLENKYKKLKSKMEEAYYRDSVVTMYYDFVSNRMKYLAELVSNEKPKKSKKTNRVK
jgi:hypothetical protein